MRSALLGGPGTGVLNQVAETLGFCGGSPNVRIRLRCVFGVDAFAQQRIFAVTDSNFKAAVRKAVQRTDKRGAAIGTAQPPENLKATHELDGEEYTSAVSRSGIRELPRSAYGSRRNLRASSNCFRTTWRHKPGD
jgi:hypothetical protein